MTLSAPVSADPVQDVTLGATVDPLFGQHVEPNGTTQFSGAPLVTIEGSARRGNAEVYAEGLPPIGTLTSSGTLGSLSTKLGLIYAVGRWYVDGNHLSLGIGETAYHQVTTRAPSAETDTSNLGGLRYELRGVVDVGHSTLALSLEATPVLAGGVQVTLGNLGAFDPERASQVEIRLRDQIHIAKNADLIAGARSINYVARYTGRDVGLADRNTGIALTLGALLRFGSP